MLGGFSPICPLISLIAPLLLISQKPGRAINPAVSIWGQDCLVSVGFWYNYGLAIVCNPIRVWHFIQVHMQTRLLLFDIVAWVRKSFRALFFVTRQKCRKDQIQFAWSREPWNTRSLCAAPAM